MAHRPQPEPACLDASSEVERELPSQGIKVLEDEPERAFDDLTRIAAQICRTPMAAIRSVGEFRPRLTSEMGLGLENMPDDGPFSSLAMNQQGVFVVREADRDPRFAESPLVRGPLGVRFYAGVPLRTAEGVLLGTLSVFDRSPRPEGLTASEEAGLSALSRAIVGLLELKRANRGLQHAEQRYGALIDASALIEFRAAPDGALVESEGWRARRRQGHEVYLGQSWLDALCPEDRARAAAQWSAILASQEAGELEFRIQTQGEFRWMLARAVPVRAPDGSIKEWVGTVTDVHAQKLADQRLRTSEERLRLAAQATTDAIWDW
ncbi:PAS domain-containing protein, partial [Enterovirga sp.]|uniref:PAS domain-containing protein n=1 Tax=Enterovirga sp. TaxID=2026350 RepID=UPI002601C2CF